MLEPSLCGSSESQAMNYSKVRSIQLFRKCHDGILDLRDSLDRFSKERKQDRSLLLKLESEIADIREQLSQKSLLELHTCTGYACGTVVSDIDSRTHLKDKEFPVLEVPAPAQPQLFLCSEEPTDNCNRCCDAVAFEHSLHQDATLPTDIASNVTRNVVPLVEPVLVEPESKLLEERLGRQETLETTHASDTQAQHKHKASEALHSVSQLEHMALHNLHHSVVVKMLPEEYPFGQSMWDAALFIGDPAIGCCASVMIFVLFLLMNVSMFVFSGIIFYNFTDPDAFGASMQDQIRTWRLQHAHLLQYSDPSVSGSSLASRVCNGDYSLLFSTVQADIVDDLGSYLPGEDVRWVFSGPALCLLATVLWCLTVIREALCILQFAAAVILHVGSKTELVHEGHSLVLKMGTTRKLLALFITIVRCGNLCVLCYSGTQYIIHTTSVEDLLLNCVALGLVLDVDGLVFEVLAPAQIQTVIECVSPLEVGRWPQFYGADMKKLSVLTILFVATTIIYKDVLTPFVTNLEKVQDLLCGGETDFVVAFDSLGVAWMAPSTAWGDGASNSHAVANKGVQMAVNGEGDAAMRQGFLVWGGHGYGPNPIYSDASHYDRLVRINKHVWYHEIQRLPGILTAESRALHLHFYDHKMYERPEGEALSVTAPGSITLSSSVLLRSLVGNNAANCDRLYELDQTTNPSETGVSCYHTWSKHATDVARVIALCPYGCGCFSPWFGTIYKSRGGCPLHSVSSDHYQDELKHFPCADPSDHGNVTIISWLRKWVRSPEFQQERHIFLGLSHDSISADLNISALLDPTSEDFCEHVYDILSDKETMAPAVCPIQFGCHEANEANSTLKLYCPHSCEHHGRRRRSEHRRREHHHHDTTITTTHHHHDDHHHRRREHHHDDTTTTNEHQHQSPPLTTASPPTTTPQDDYDNGEPPTTSGNQLSSPTTASAPPVTTTSPPATHESPTITASPSPSSPPLQSFGTSPLPTTTQPAATVASPTSPSPTTTSPSPPTTAPPPTTTAPSPSPISSSQPIIIQDDDDAQEVDHHRRRRHEHHRRRRRRH